MRQLIDLFISLQQKFETAHEDQINKRDLQMIQKDYIMNMIEQTGKILAKVVLNKEEGKQEDAIKEIDKSFSQLVGIDSEILNALSSEGVSELFGINIDKSTGSMKCILVAKLLKEKGDLQIKVHPETSIQTLHKALLLYLKGILNLEYTEINMKDNYSDVMSIENVLKGRLSIEEIFLLFEFYKKIKEFDKAKDYLLFLRDSNYPNINKIGLSFFHELGKEEGMTWFA